MQVPVFIESLPAGRYRARAAAPFSVEAESADKSVAVADVKREMDRLVAAGEVVMVEVDAPNAAVAMLGTLDKNDPAAQDWWRYVQEFREQMNSFTYPGENTGDGV